MRTTLSLAIFFYPVLASSLPGQPPGKLSPKWTVDDVILAERATDFRLSPDGKQVLWVKGSPDEEAGKVVEHVFRSVPADRRETQMTRGADSCTHPRWSPDGRLIAFLSKRPANESKTDRKGRGGDDEDSEPQLWVMDSAGGEPWRLTDLKRPVLTFAWAGNEEIVYLAQESPGLAEQKREKEEDDSVVVEDDKNEPPARLFRIKVGSKKVLRLTDNRDSILSFALSPQGTKALAVHARSLSYDYDHKVKPAVYLHDLAKGERRQVFKDEKYNVVGIQWTPDGKGAYLGSLRTSHPRYLHAYVNELYHFDAESGEERPVNLARERGLADQPENGYAPGFVVTESGVLALLADGLRPRLARYVRTGPAEWKREWLTGEHVANVFALTADRAGKHVVYTHSTADSPPRVFYARLDGPAVKDATGIAAINEGWGDLPKAKVEVLRWKGALGEEVEGLLYYPHGHDASRKYPLLVMIHGGPFGADYDSWEESWAYPANLYASRGTFVLKVNYHGSSGYGLAFAESLAGGKYYDLPLEDIETGVDHVIGKGLADPERLATMGWSNGAILSAALIVKNQRYRAASLGAGGAEWVADWGACEFGLSFSNYYFGKSPLEDPQLYFRMSPLYRFEQVRTPTIIFQGEADRAVPVHHAWSQFRTLQQLGKADTRLILFPGEEHSLRQLAHQRRKVTEELDWLERHFLGTHREENPALKSDSPLALALKLKAARREGTRYGVTVKGVLIPEVVEYEGLSVGRFEVTAAQYAEFDRNLKVEPGRENYPVVGIGVERAREYCRWLSEKTGEPYRLPDEDGAELLYEDRDAEGENTLDYWAGYEVNPDDAARLREKVRELGGATPLLREVGKFKGSGKDEPVFDLGGNAAEWVVTGKGRGRPAGGCAACPVDERRRENAPSEYVGFRVIRESKN